MSKWEVVNLSRGNSGVAGPQGQSAYQVAVDNGFVGTESDWLASLVGAPGEDGENGTNGTNGTNGAAATIAVNSTSTGAPGSDALVTNVGTSSAASLDFVIPRGDPGIDGTNGTNGSNGADGAAATVAVGATTTGSPGSSASVTNSGTSSAAVFNFTVPRGDPAQGWAVLGSALYLR